MSGLTRELLLTLADALRADPELAREVATVLAPHLPDSAGTGWLNPRETSTYLGLGSLDALDRLVREGLPCSQPSGPGGKRYFERVELDRWMRAAS